MGTQKFYLELTLSYCNAWTGGGSCWLAGREEGATVAVLSDSSTEWVFPRTKPNNVLRPASAYHATHASLSAFRPSEGKLCASYRARSSNSVLTVTGTSKGIEALFPMRTRRGAVAQACRFRFLGPRSLASLLNLRMPCLESAHTFFLVKSGEQSNLRGGPRPDCDL